MWRHAAVGLLVGGLALVPAAHADSAKDTLKACIAKTERHRASECDAAYQQWRAERLHKFVAERPLHPTPAPATPTVAPTATSTGVPPVAGPEALAIPETDDLGQAAITWFGSIDPAHKYADIRLAHSGSDLLVSVSVIDQFLSEGRDAVELTVGGFSQRIALSLNTPWRGTGFDDGLEDRGWLADFRVPNVPSNVTLPLTVTLRDEASVSQTFTTLIRTSPEPFTPATGARTATVEVVVDHDASVGGGSNCAGDVDPDFFAKFGTVNRTNDPDFNVQSESDISDWPCFNKWYGVFPAVSGGIVKAELILHQFGNAGGPDWTPPAEPSLLQAASTDVWNGSLTWNTAPRPKRIVGRAWVDLMRVPLQWPGVERVIDVSPAVVSGQPTSLVLYTADLHYHSGKYFVSGSTGDWNAAGRPRLRVTVAR